MILICTYVTGRLVNRIAYEVSAKSVRNKELKWTTNGPWTKLTFMCERVPDARFSSVLCNCTLDLLKLAEMLSAVINK
jgi:hypothetical protein